MYNIHGIAHMLSERREPNCKGTFYRITLKHLNAKLNNLHI